MTSIIPSLKRVKVSSPQELGNWLAKHDTIDAIMVVTVAAPSSRKYVSQAEISAVAAEFGWQIDRGFTLNGGLRGEIIRRVGS